MPTEDMYRTLLRRDRGTPRRTPAGVPAHGEDPGLVPPVEVPGAAPEALVAVGGRLDAVRVCVHRDEVLLGVVGDGHGSVERVLDARLLLGLEQRVVLEGISALVAIDRHVPLELGVLLLQPQVILNDVGEVVGHWRWVVRGTALPLPRESTAADCKQDAGCYAT